MCESTLVHGESHTDLHISQLYTGALATNPGFLKDSKDSFLKLLQQTLQLVWLTGSYGFTIIRRNLKYHFYTSVQDYPPLHPQPAD